MWRLREGKKDTVTDSTTWEAACADTMRVEAKKLDIEQKGKD